MDTATESLDALIRSGARRLTGFRRRAFIAEVAREQCALRMRWKGRHPTVKRLDGDYPDGVRVPAKEMKTIEARLERSTTLPKYDITIKPRAIDPQVK